MRFIITDKSFYLEEGGVLSSELQAWQEEFKRDKEYAWYLLGLKGCPSDADIYMRFLCRAAESYFRCLTSLPELELSREKTEVFFGHGYCSEAGGSGSLHDRRRVPGR